MPFSSGGGSSDGGISGGSSSSSSSSPNWDSIHTEYFEGAHRYRYHDRVGEEHYVYSLRQPRRQTVGGLIKSLLITLPFVAVGIWVIVTFFSYLLPLRPLKNAIAQPDYYIDDRIGVINDVDALEQSLVAFKEKTGIIPYVLTVYDSEWEDNYSNLENYAYQTYLDTFQDESHFLIVFSQPEGGSAWEWQAIQGDNTARILSEDHFSTFQLKLQDGLGGPDVGLAFNQAFQESLSYVMEGSDWPTLLGLLFFMLAWNGFVGYIYYAAIQDFVRSRRDYTQVS